MNKSTFSVGDIYPLASGREVIITELLPKYRCKVRILGTEYYQTCIVHRLRYGGVKDKYLPSVYGKGFIGEGKYVVSLNGVHTKEYSTWASILERVYVTCHSVTPSYLTVTLFEDWHNFQIFAEWCHNQTQFHIKGEVWEIDKDIYKYSENLQFGVYAPYSCYFVPRELNGAFVLTNRVGRRYPAGVQPWKDKFKAELSCSGKSIFSPMFTTIQEAADWYLFNKKAYIAKLANKYKDRLNQECYKRLVNIDLSTIELLKAT